MERSERHEGEQIRLKMEEAGCWEEVDRLVMHRNGEICRLAEKIVTWTWDEEMEEEIEAAS